MTDVKTGNVSALASLKAFLVVLFNRLQGVSKRALPRRLWFRDGLPWGFVKGQVVGPTPTAHLDLQPGEMVRIKTKEQIEETLNGTGSTEAWASTRRWPATAAAPRGCKHG